MERQDEDLGAVRTDAVELERRDRFRRVEARLDAWERSRREHDADCYCPACCERAAIDYFAEAIRRTAE